MTRWVCITVGMMTEETKVLSEKPVLVTLCLPQTPHERSWNRGQTSRVWLMTNHLSHNTTLRRRISRPDVVTENDLLEKHRHTYVDTCETGSSSGGTVQA
jgi:hypothetical protein